LVFRDEANIHQPTDFGHAGLHRTAGNILDMHPRESTPTLSLPDESRPIDAPYVCIAVQASTRRKYWTNPLGWAAVVQSLRELGFRVICVDRQPVHGGSIVWNHIPHGAEDETRGRPLARRAHWLRHAAFFVGLSSGLSWLACAAGTPAILISGFTHSSNEFQTPYQVINWRARNLLE